MTFKILAAGKASHDYAKLGINEYVKRLKRYTKCELRFIKDGSSEDVSERLLKACKGSYIIALDERGKDFTSQSFAQNIRELTDNPGIKSVSFLIGASDGHTEALRKEAHQLIRLSKMTLMHELALVVLLEQIYRAHTILKGEPYHR